ncbi:MAG TPA: hypothetical protein VGY76_10560 [Solirubrobacteraceae bacterium]|jgi:hypothetical protein|nr:hypothetical protein [Solirubrobacteraceae bacterium]
MQRTDNTSRRTPPLNSACTSRQGTQDTRPAELDTQGLDARDVMCRPAAFFGLSKYASDPASRLIRGPLAYRPI